MKNRKAFRKGFGLAQIMALLLVVLPTMAFIVTFLIDYWTVMQADWRLKIIANKTSDAYNNVDTDSAVTFATVKADLEKSLLSQCPGGKKYSVSRITGINNVEVTVKYSYKGSYISQDISTKMNTYSYHDINSTVTGECK